MSYDQFIAALCLWREGRSAGKAALAGIWSVLRNRVADPLHRWPRSLPGVITQRAQFSSFSAGDPNATKFPIPDSRADWQAWLDCVGVVCAPVYGDPTDGATNYESCQPGELPAWASDDTFTPNDRLTVKIGPFRFYKL